MAAQVNGWNEGVTRSMSSAATRWTPKYWQLVEQFRKQIDVGELKPGDRLPSYTEMRVEYGASRPTTEKMHGILEREGYIVREPGRGTFVAPARPPVSHSVIGFAGFTATAGRHPYGAHLVEGVHLAAMAEGMEVLLLGVSTEIAWEKIDGIVIISAEPEIWLSRLPPGMPHVVLLASSPDSAYVVADDQHGTFEATKHLLALGHRRIGYLISSPEVPLSMSRLAGYRAALRQAGIRGRDDWIRTIPRFQGGTYHDRAKTEMKAWMDSGWAETGCTALLAQNDDAAMGVIQLLQERGFRVPEDVSVVGFDGTEAIQYAKPRPTTVEVPLQELSMRATEILIRQMKSADEPEMEHVVLPTRLIVGESTGPAPK